MKDQMHKYKMQNHGRGEKTAKKKKRMWELQVGLKANMSKAEKSPER